jgi:RNA recognition motif-containing protein
MAVRLFVGNLPYDVTETELKELFSPVVAPTSVRIPMDRETGRPRGFAFVEFGETSQAQEVIQRFHQQVFKGRPLVINEARPREEGAGPRPRPTGPPAWSGAPTPAERGPRPASPARNFGPDAPPRGKRKTKSRGPKGERAPKRPIPERGGGQFFSEDLDDLASDQGADDVAFWEREVPEDEDEK